MAGSIPRCHLTSREYSNESIATYGINSLFPGYSNARAVCDDVSIRPIVPMLMPGAVPPEYITCSASIAIAGRDIVANKQRVVASLFTPDLPDIYRLGKHLLRICSAVTLSSL